MITKYQLNSLPSSTDSQPIVSLEPSLDIGKLKDPEEFFLAYEKFESKLLILIFKN